jgi:hypothetical protein
MKLALMIAFAPAVLIPLAASRGALSRGHWFAFSLALLPLLLFIPLQDTSMSGAILFGLLLSEGVENVPPYLAFISGAYLILVGCTLGCLLGALIYPAEKTE